MDFPLNGEMVHFYFYPQQSAVNVFLDIAGGDTALLSANDRLLAAEMVKKGYVRNDDGMLSVNAPVFTPTQFEALTALLEPAAELLVDKAEVMMQKIMGMLQNYLPSHLQGMSKDLSYLYLFEDAVAAPMQVLYDRSLLKPYHGNGMLPTTYVVLT